MKYRKKPIVVDAYHFADGNEFPKWLTEANANGMVRFRTVGFPENQRRAQLLIYTSAGIMTAEKGDLIIRDVKGELYPCKPDIFEATYEPVEDAKPDLTLRDVVCDWLKQHGYDGLAGEECGCLVDDLMPCDEPNVHECVPGYRIPCPEGDECPYRCYTDKCEFHVVQEKPKDGI